MILLIILTLLLPFHESIMVTKKIEDNVDSFMFIHYYQSLEYTEEEIICNDSNFIKEMNQTIISLTSINSISNLVISYDFDELKINLKITFDYKYINCLIVKEINIYEK